MADQSLEFEIKTTASTAAIEKYRQEIDRLAAAVPNSEKRKADFLAALDAKTTADVEAATRSNRAAALRRARATDRASALAQAQAADAGAARDLISQVPTVGPLLARFMTAAAAPIAAVAAGIGVIAAGLREVAKEQDMVARLKGFGFDAAGMAGHVQAVKDLAKATGGDWAGATEIYIRAAAGHTRALKVLGFEIDENATRTERLAQLQGQLAARAMKIAAAEAGTFSGELKKSGKSLGDIAQAMVTYSGIAWIFGKGLKLINFELGLLRRGTMAYAELVQGNFAAAKAIILTGEAQARAATTTRNATTAIDDQIEELERLKQKLIQVEDQQKQFIEIEQQLADQAIDMKVLKGEITPEQAAAMKGGTAARAAERKQEVDEKAARDAVTLARDKAFRLEGRFNQLKGDLPEPGSAEYGPAKQKLLEVQKQWGEANREVEGATRQQETVGRRAAVVRGQRGLADRADTNQFLDDLWNNSTPQQQQRLAKPRAREQSEATAEYMIRTGQDRAGMWAKALEAMKAKDAEELRLLEYIANGRRHARTP